MVRITIDEELKQRLLSSGEVVELCDESGRLLGRILPHRDAPTKGWEPLTPEPTEEELRRSREYDGPGMTTDELLAHLRRKR